MKNAMRLKAIMKNIAKEKNISAQLVMQNFMLERLLERVSLSKYQQNFILKGGFLIAAMVGLDSRSTMDMDATIKGYPVNEQTIVDMFTDICNIDLTDDVDFTFKSISEIREGDDYNGFRVSLTANYPPMQIPLKLDITTGDEITPREIEYKFKLMLEERSISVMAYNLETVLAEKLETVISRGDLNTRPRDYYDVYILTKLQIENINLDELRLALQATTQKRGSSVIIKNYSPIIQVIKSSPIMQKQWENYRKDLEYASQITFDDVCNSVLEIIDRVNNV